MKNIYHIFLFFEEQALYSEEKPVIFDYVNVLGKRQLLLISNSPQTKGTEHNRKSYVNTFGLWLGTVCGPGLKTRILLHVLQDIDQMLQEYMSLIEMQLPLKHR